MPPPRGEQALTTPDALVSLEPGVPPIAPRFLKVAVNQQIQ
jgi:hypothetical protein